MSRAFVLSVLTVLGTCAIVSVRAQAPDQAAVTAAGRTLEVHPAIEPTPALRYRLLPTFYERKPGNAAALYKTAALLLAGHQEELRTVKFNEWLQMPLQDLPQEEVTKALSGFSDVLRYVELGAWRERCEWDWALEEGADILLPDLSHYRTIGRLLALEARLQILRHDYAGAVHTLETGFSLAAHLAEGPVLINDLVAIAIASILLNAAEDLVQAPDAPSLYWALTALPTPLINLDEAIEFELGGMCWSPKELRHPEEACLSPAEWADVFGRLARLTGSGQEREEQRDIALAARALASYTDAKRHLTETGEAPERVEAMPVLQVVAIYLRDGWRVSADEALTRWYTPYAQALTEPNRAEQIVTEAGTRKDGWLVWLFMPALERTRYEQMKLDRRIAALRVVEAIRLHAAATAGRLPARLEDVRQAPIPPNPMRGEPFTYELQAGRAVLSAAAERGDTADSQIRYEIEIAK
jgi:hypothetical protein